MKCVLTKVVFFAISIQSYHSASVDNSKHGSERVVPDRKLSDKQHFDGDHVHDYDYDHEAFLGKDEAREFDQLTPEESKGRLGKIVDRIDSNEDGYVTLDEMRDWIRFTQQRYVSEDVDRQWNQHNVDNGETITWDQYRALVYGFLDEDLGEDAGDEDTLSYQYVHETLCANDFLRWLFSQENGGSRSTALGYCR